MKRALVFLVLGPAVVAIVASTLDPLGYMEIVLFLFTVAVSVFAGSADGFLARVLPISVRAPLTAIVGATVAYGLAYALPRFVLPAPMLTPFALGGAFCMCVCSLLSHDYGSYPSTHSASPSASRGT